MVIKDVTDLEQHFDSIDEYLGAGEGRFFGGGYRRVSYRLVSVSGDQIAGRLHGQVMIKHPADWSTKKRGRTLVPHLSTVDAMVLVARFADVALRQLIGLNDGAVRLAHLRRLDITAGSAPVEEGLDRVPVTVEARDGRPAGDATTVTTVAGHVGGMTFHGELEHPTALDRPLTVAPSGTWDWLHDSPYGTALHRREQRIRQVHLHRPGAGVQAEVDVVDPIQPDSAPAATLVDAFVVSLQLGQMLLYDLDGLDRAGTNNLWMRRATLVCSDPLGFRSSPTAGAHLDDARLLNLRGATWRAATIVADCLGVQTRCAVAHELPSADDIAA